MAEYRLALDIGTNSIGWCALCIEDEGSGPAPTGIIDMGVRIFPDGRNPKDGSSKAVKRRQARAIRRNRDRFVRRRNLLIRRLIAFGLLPEDEEQRRGLTELDPYELRARGVNDELTPYELGRALFHLNQRRGFKSNRKTDAKDSDDGMIKQALREQAKEMKADETFGTFLFRQREAGATVRARKKTRCSEDAKGKEKKQDYYEIYPGRKLIEQEFEALWATQARYHPSLLTQAAHDKLHDAIFHQRPLKQPVVGKCIFDRNEDRAPRALPVVQRCRIYQELNHLTILDNRHLRGEPLTIEQRDRLAALMCKPNGRKSGKAEISFDKMRKTLGLTSNAVFSHESEKRKGLEADTTSALLSHKTRFGPRWHELPDAEQESIVTRLLHGEDEEALIQWLMDGWNLDRKQAEGVSCTPLPDRYGNLGMTATRKILAQLVQAVIPYSEAVRQAGYTKHSQFASGEKRPRLPYYGEILERHVIPDPEKAGHPAARLEERYGRIANPTVHIALNQLRRVENEVIKLYGSPAQIHVEVLRDLKNSCTRPVNPV